MKRLIALLLMVILLTPTNSYAHTTLVSSSPKERAVLNTSPKTISLTFNENLIKISGKNISRISLLDSSKKPVALGKITLNRSKLTAPVQSILATGKYTIRYRVVSADGHPVTGTINFSVK